LARKLEIAQEAQETGEFCQGDRTVRVLFFSVLREMVGIRELDLAISGVTSANDLIAAIADKVPEVGEFASCIRLAVNGIYADSNTLIRPGDEVAVITPVSGG